VAPVAAPAQAAAPPASPILPPLADAFAALLEAEQGDPQQTAVAWPTRPAAAITDDLVEQVARRVLEHLTDRAVRETVTTLAERLILEEIERIKKTIE
jgi:hypothetical protein